MGRIRGGVRDQGWRWVGLGICKVGYSTPWILCTAVMTISTWYHSSPLQIGKRVYNLQELTKIGQLKTGKMLPGLMSLDFC